MNDLSSDDAIFFTEAMESLGLNQHVHTATHQAGNTLDLVLTNDLQISQCLTMDFISNHKAVICEMLVQKSPPKSKEIQYRKFTMDNISELENKLDLDPLLN